MTCGIYKLTFNGTDKVYIGKSINIEIRYLHHKQALKSKTASIKMQKAYETYGMPSLEILCECDESELYALEAEAIDIYNSAIDGFNTMKTPHGGEHSSLMIGEESPSSQHSNEEYIEVARLLANSNMSVNQISNKLGISRNIVAQIKHQANHKWIKDKEPLLYETITIKLNSYRKEGLSSLYQKKIYDILVSPDNIEYEVTNINKFARQHNLDCGNLCRLLNKQYKYYKGWRLKSTSKQQYIKFISPRNEVFILENISILQFSKIHGLDNSAMSKLAKGTKLQHKGWKLYLDEQ
jgi:predicted DNA-binding protein (UPF0251 family)